MGWVTMNNKTYFGDNRTKDSFSRVDEVHPLDIYAGYDSMSRQTLLFITSLRPGDIKSSKIISASFGKRHDGKFSVSFSLMDNNFEDIFNHFCGDIIESSRNISSETKASKFIIKRYSQWQDMLAKQKGNLLSPSVIKGLIGELCFLLNYLLPLYGEDLAVNSWIGPEKADQDFVLNDNWYEVKSTTSGTDIVLISSIEQLDSPNQGQLVVVYLNKTSESDKSRITINSIYKTISDNLFNDDNRKKLSSILLNFGYFATPDYESFGFSLDKIERYRVDSNFPTLRRSMLPYPVINTKYTLSISSVKNYIQKD